MFLHGGWLHLAGNMWFLWIFGNNVEDRLGSWLYLVFYLVGGILATSCHWAYDPRSVTPVIGASGAVATVLGAYAVTFPTANVRTLVFIGLVTVIDIPAIIWLGLWLGGQLVDAVFVGDLAVAVWAHIGGFAAGAFLMPILTFGMPPHGTSWDDEIKKQFSFPPPEGR
jgi:membrane associated rhomboid family serine protease